MGNDHFVRNNHPRNVKRNKKKEKKKKKNSLSNPIYHSSLIKANSPDFRKSVSNDFARSKTGLIALFKTDKTFTHKASRIVERETNFVIHLNACYLLSRKGSNLIYSEIGRMLDNIYMFYVRSIVECRSKTDNFSKKIFYPSLRNLEISQIASLFNLEELRLHHYSWEIIAQSKFSNYHRIPTFIKKEKKNVLDLLNRSCICSQVILNRTK